MHISRRRSSRADFKQKMILYALLGVAGVIVFAFIVGFGIFAWYGRKLPSPGKLTELNENATVFYDRNDKILFELYKDKNRVPVTSDNISKYLKQATVAIEDKDFYKHNGFSEKGIIRSAINMILHKGEIQGGGSTITQ